MSKPDVITLAMMHDRLEQQGVSHQRHYAFRCPICGTVQSLASLVAAGLKPEVAERQIAFSCEGRATGAGPWPAEQTKSAKAARRRLIRGCDWTLGGLFRLHAVEIKFPDGELRPCFDIATADEAKALEVSLSERAREAGVPAVGVCKS